MRLLYVATISVFLSALGCKPSTNFGTQVKKAQPVVKASKLPTSSAIKPVASAGAANAAITNNNGTNNVPQPKPAATPNIVPPSVVNSNNVANKPIVNPVVTDTQMYRPIPYVPLPPPQPIPNVPTLPPGIPCDGNSSGIPGLKAGTYNVSSQCYAPYFGPGGHFEYCSQVILTPSCTDGIVTSVTLQAAGHFIFEGSACSSAENAVMTCDARGICAGPEHFGEYTFNNTMAVTSPTSFNYHTNEVNCDAVMTQ